MYSGVHDNVALYVLALLLAFVLFLLFVIDLSTALHVGSIS